MITVAILTLLAGIIVLLVGSLDAKAKTTKTVAQMKILSEAVTAFKNSTGYFPLSVPEDAWGTEDWTSILPAAFINQMSWRDHVPNYFQLISGNAKFDWDGNTNPSNNPKPTNIHILAFQLEQVPESKKIIDGIKELRLTSNNQQNFSGGNWIKNNNPCKLYHPLDSATATREAYQFQDAWGTPLRFWTSDILNWAKNGGAWDPTISEASIVETSAGKLGIFH